MSYAGRQPIGYLGLGAASPTDRYGLKDARTFVNKHGGVQRKFDRNWVVMHKDDPRLVPLNMAMRKQRMGPVAWELVGSIEGKNWEIREGRPSMKRLKGLWMRHGRKPDWWAGAKGEYNFGPNTNQSRVLRLNKEFFDYITNPRVPLFAPHKDGFVRMWFNDPMLEEVRAKLISTGYLAPHDAVSTKDNSAFVRALRTVFEKERERRGGQLKTNGKSWWPSGINFGPNTNGNELRVHPDFLVFLMTQRLPPSSQTPRAGMVIKAPVYGPLPTSRPGGKPTWALQSNVSSRFRRILGT